MNNKHSVLKFGSPEKDFLSMPVLEKTEVQINVT